MVAGWLVFVKARTLILRWRFIRASIQTVLARLNELPNLWSVVNGHTISFHLLQSLSSSEPLRVLLCQSLLLKSNIFFPTLTKLKHRHLPSCSSFGEKPLFAARRLALVKTHVRWKSFVKNNVFLVLSSGQTGAIRPFEKTRKWLTLSQNY